MPLAALAGKTVAARSAANQALAQRGVPATWHRAAVASEATRARRARLPRLRHLEGRAIYPGSIKLPRHKRPSERSEHAKRRTIGRRFSESSPQYGSFAGRSASSLRPAPMNWSPGLTGFRPYGPQLILSPSENSVCCRVAAAKTGGNQPSAAVATWPIDQARQYGGRPLSGRKYDGGPPSAALPRRRLRAGRPSVGERHGTQCLPKARALGFNAAPGRAIKARGWPKMWPSADESPAAGSSAVLCCALRRWLRPAGRG